MKLSIFTTMKDPDRRGDNWQEALKCYSDLADELVIVNGGNPLFTENPKIHEVENFWYQDFDWTFIGEQFQRGYEACTGSWVIHADLDFIFHQQDFDAIRRACQEHNDQPAFSMLKRQFILPDRFNVKSRLVVAVNKGKFGNRIKFNSSGDLCQPSLDGKYIEAGSVPDVKIPFYNYEKILKTKEQIKDDTERMARAWNRTFGNWKLGTTETAYDEWYKMQAGRFNKPHQSIKLTDHPMYMQETIKNLTEEQFGFNGFGLIDGRVYA